MEFDPPWEEPAGGCADGGGVTGKRHMGKSLETMGRKARCVGANSHARPVAVANHGKPWGSKARG